MSQDIVAASHNLQISKNLIEDLSDEELASTIGGCDIQITTYNKEISVLLPELPLLEKSYVNIANNAVSVVYDPNGSARYESWKRK
ncbi:MAG TPA: hypothetical protein IGS40_23640 [Trichormus sp. M33_DOE_039]|nr:hypothetical protein [Trichormus sp. M33_DOE_039]